MRHSLIIILAIFLICPSVYAQELKVPTLSPISTIQQEIGLTEISLTYSRPSAKGRKIMGQLVPYDEIWRTGANKATTITFSEEVKIADHKIIAGTYAIYTIPSEKEWTIIIHKKTNFRSIAGGKIKPENDACRFKVNPIENPLTVETFTMQFTNLHTKGCSVQLAWENMLVSIPITVNVDDKIAAKMTQLLKDPDAVSHRDYFRAAEYYLHNNKDLSQSLNWINDALLKSENNFRYGLLKSKIFAAQGNTEQAIETVQLANQWAATAKNENYIGQTSLYLKELQTPLKPSQKLANINGIDLLDKSIKYHDPNGQWSNFNATLYLEQSRPNNEGKDKSEVIINLPDSYFKVVDNRRGNSIIREVNGTNCSTHFNGNSTFSEEDKKKHRLTCERAKMFRDYFAYLYGLPMKLKDEGTIIGREVYTTTFQDQACLSMRVTYDETVGEDIWYFYFHPSTYALIGYRFYHEEAKNDGEYITLEGEESVQGIKIPKNRHWYYNKDDKFLGADFLVRGTTPN